MTINVTKTFTFDAAHNIPEHSGLCKNLHGHTYLLEVTLLGEDNSLDRKGMLLDFGELKRLINHLVVDKWDHSVLIYPQTDFEKDLVYLLNKHDRRVIVFDKVPTAENMAIEIKKTLEKYIRAKFRVKLYETPTSFAEVE